MNVVMVKFGGSKGEWVGTRSVFLLGTWFSCVEQKDRQEGFFFNLGLLGERPTVAVGNCLQEGEGPVHRKRVLDGSA